MKTPILILVPAHAMPDSEEFARTLVGGVYPRDQLEIWNIQYGVRFKTLSEMVEQWNADDFTETTSEFYAADAWLEN